MTFEWVVRVDVSDVPPLCRIDAMKRRHKKTNAQTIDDAPPAEASPDAAAAESDPPAVDMCVFCGCTDELACNPPCSWIDDSKTICSHCDLFIRHARAWIAGARNPDLLSFTDLVDHLRECHREELPATKHAPRMPENWHNTLG